MKEKRFMIFSIILVIIAVSYLLVRDTGNTKLSAPDTINPWNSNKYFINRLSEWLRFAASSYNKIDSPDDEINGKPLLMLLTYLNSRNVFYMDNIYVKRQNSDGTSFFQKQTVTYGDDGRLTNMGVDLIEVSLELKPGHEPEPWVITQFPGRPYAIKAPTSDVPKQHEGLVTWCLLPNSTWGEDTFYATLKFPLEIEKNACFACCSRHGIDFDGCMANGWNVTNNDFTKDCPIDSECLTKGQKPAWAKTQFVTTNLTTIKESIWPIFGFYTKDLIKSCCNPGLAPKLDENSYAYQYACKKGSYNPKGRNCDEFMRQYCKPIPPDPTEPKWIPPDNYKDPICGCYPDFPRTENEQLVEKALKEKKVLVNTSPVCLYSSCANGLAYKETNPNDEKCSNLCLNIINNKAGDWAHINFENVTVNLDCDNGVIIANKTEPPKPEPPKPEPPNPNKNRNVLLITGISVAGLLLIIAIAWGLYIYL